MKRVGDTARIALLLATVCATPFALCTPAAAQTQPAQAQSGDDQNDEEIVVTARRTEESLQDVPASVSAFSEHRLEQIGATDATGLQGAVPNLNIVQGRGSSNATNIYIRGVGQPDALQTFDPAVGFYVDDVYYSRIRGTQMELFDVDRVEVLRGPQGTLYGRNTIGGAYKIVTRRPGQDPHGSAQVTVGDYGLLEARLAASGPISDTLAVGATVFGTSRDGYVTNPTTGEDYNDRNAWGARAQLAWDPTSNFSADLSVDYQSEDNALTMGQPLNNLTNILGGTVYVVPSPTPDFTYHASATPGLPNHSDMTHKGAALHLSWDLGNHWTINSITSRRLLNYDDYVDIDATPVQLGDVQVAVGQNQTSQEFQAIYNGDRLTLVGGVYYLREDVGSHQEAYANAYVTGFLGLTSFTRTIDDDLVTTSQAAYLNATYALTPRLNVSAGLRYTVENKDYDRSTSTFYSNPVFNSTFAFSVSDSWTDTSPMLSVDYHLTDDLMVYARASRGFMSGGFNGRSNNPGEEAPYNPETITSYEAGLRSTWLDGRLSANFSVFNNTFKDFQARVSDVVHDPITDIDVAAITVVNAGELDISGAELELAYNPIDSLHLDAQIGYLDASYGSFDDARFPGGSRAFQEPAFSPHWTARFGASYDWNLGQGGTFTLAGSARYRSEMALAIDNTYIVGNVGTTTRVPGLFQDAYWLYDASATWRPNDVLSIALVGSNLSDEVYKTDAQEFSSVGSIRTAYYGAPQTVRLVFTARY